MSWRAAGSHESPVSEGTLASFATPFLPPEALDDPRYASSRGTPWDTIETLFPPWFAQCWRAVAPRSLDAHLRHLDGHRTFGLRKGEWEDDGG